MLRRAGFHVTMQEPGRGRRGRGRGRPGRPRESGAHTRDCQDVLQALFHFDLEGNGLLSLPEALTLVRGLRGLPCVPTCRQVASFPGLLAKEAETRRNAFLAACRAQKLPARRKPGFACDSCRVSFALSLTVTMSCDCVSLNSEPFPRRVRRKRCFFGFRLLRSRNWLQGPRGHHGTCARRKFGRVPEWGEKKQRDNVRMKSACSLVHVNCLGISLERLIPHSKREKINIDLSHTCASESYGSGATTANEGFPDLRITRTAQHAGLRYHS